MTSGCESGTEPGWAEGFFVSEDPASASVDSPTSDLPDLMPGMRIDDFKILGEIGRGRMGVVYRAYQHTRKRVVALKFLRPGISADRALANRIRMAVMRASKLSHHGIAPIYHIEAAPEFRYYTMAFVPGESLQERLQARGPLAPDAVVSIGLQACEALQHAHDHNIGHGDLRPSHVLLTSGINRAQITDFGLPHGQPPKPGNGKASRTKRTNRPTLDPKGDVLSLGMTLYFALTGTAPYEGASEEVLAKVFREHIPPVGPGNLNARVGRALDSAVLRMLSLNRQHRYQTSGQARAALDKAAQHDGIRLPQTPEEAARSVLSHRKDKKAHPTLKSTDLAKREARLDHVENLSRLRRGGR